jgi:general secretion pathway protein G
MPSQATIRRSRERRGVTSAAILAFLGAIAFASYLFAERHQALPPDSPEQTRAKIEAAKTFTQQQTAPMFASYKKDTGNYPATAEGIWSLAECPPRVAGWQGPYLAEPAMPIDPWGQVYQYAFPGRHNGAGHYDVWSNGPDGLSGTADDVGNW